MHELGIMTGVMESVDVAAKDAGADKVLKVSLSVGVMTEAIEDALRFAFEALSEGTLCEGAELDITMVQPKSRCLECGAEYEHDRLHMLCPACGSFATQLLAGKELQIDSIEVDIPDDEEADGDCGTEGHGASGENEGAR
ncbi:hydrogenase maturation nickel metallochaperone HypA [Raoultibacter phocaeensis]|uniref:hydrogenase maturation nickel metallochaperone HypA n=1 Tax=Raoultibacter phocaeensis TaxID=2479841 RepID=UPI00111830C3|nr:hydrogenase maturation nickel metallochaperone HypA [Raoultibacter phocaeensis]